MHQRCTAPHTEGSVVVIAGLPAEVPWCHGCRRAHHWSFLWQPPEAGGQCAGASPHAEHHALPHQRCHLPLCGVGHPGIFLQKADETQRLC